MWYQSQPDLKAKHEQTTVCLTLSNDSVPSSEVALPPSTAAGSKEVPRTVKTLTLSLHLTVLRAFPVNAKMGKEVFEMTRYVFNS